MLWKKVWKINGSGFQIQVNIQVVTSLIQVDRKYGFNISYKLQIGYGSRINLESVQASSLRGMKLSAPSKYNSWKFDQALWAIYFSSVLFSDRSKQEVIKLTRNSTSFKKDGVYIYILSTLRIFGGKDFKEQYYQDSWYIWYLFSILIFIINIFDIFILVIWYLFSEYQNVREYDNVFKL